MTSGLEDAATVLALFSPAYFGSRFALAELHAAFADDPLNERGSILPLLIEEHDVPKPFNALVVVDCRNLDEATFRTRMLGALAPYEKAQARRADPRIPETNTASAARKLLDDLEVANTIFVSQCEVRNALVHAMRERDASLELTEYEPFIARYYASMTPDERALHERIREHTETIEKLNRHALYCVEASKDFQRRIRFVKELREHLRAWLEKYERIFESDPSVGVLYVGVEERKPFPRGVEAEIERYVEEMEQGAAAAQAR